jgi:hypothetical protein
LNGWLPGNPIWRAYAGEGSIRSNNLRLVGAPHAPLYASSRTGRYKTT